MKGDFELGRPLHFDDIKEFHCVYRLFLFDIFKAKDQERMRVEITKKSNKKETKDSNNPLDEIDEEELLGKKTSKNRKLND